MPASEYPLWDIPTGIFHWLIVGCLPIAWWSAEEERFDVHQWTGYTVGDHKHSYYLGVYRQSSFTIHDLRFTDFVVGPARVAAYLQGRGSSSAGHNPLGGWFVLLLLLLLLVQAISGLFNSDGVLFSGPLYYWSRSGFRDAMGVVHDLVFNGLLALVFLHISAVFYHQLKLKDKLLQAMLHGSALGQVGTAVPASGRWAVIIATTAGLALWWGLAQAPQPSLSW